MLVYTGFTRSSSDFQKESQKINNETRYKSLEKIANFQILLQIEFSKRIYVSMISQIILKNLGKAKLNYFQILTELKKY